MKKFLFVVLASFLFAGISYADKQARQERWGISSAPNGLPKVPNNHIDQYGSLYKKDIPENSPCEWQPYSAFAGNTYCPEQAGQTHTCKITPEIMIKCYPAISWEELLAKSFDSFVYGHARWLNTCILRSGDQSPVCNRVKVRALVEGLNPLPAKRYSPNAYEAIKPIMTKLLQSPETLGVIYDWAIVPFRHMFAKLQSKDRREFYSDVLQHALEYASSFDVEKEKSYLSRLQSQRQERDFIYKAPDGKASHYRLVEAFIFRRVRDGMSIENIRKWLGRIVADVKLLV